MITLSLLKYLEDNGLGQIDRNLFWQKLTLDRIGIYISSVGETRERGGRKSQRYELYSRGTNDVQGYKQLQDVLDFLEDNFVVCNLPAVYDGNTIITAGFENVTIMPPSSITNNGIDANGRVIYSATGLLYY